MKNDFKISLLGSIILFLISWKSSVLPLDLAQAPAKEPVIFYQYPDSTALLQRISHLDVRIFARYDFKKIKSISVIAIRGRKPVFSAITYDKLNSKGELLIDLNNLGIQADDRLSISYGNLTVITKMVD
jgi:hypothetical protein